MILNSPYISGSLTVTGNIIASGSITLSGSVASASYAATASFVALAQSASNAVSAATASSADNLLVRNTLTAQTLVVQTITSSVDFVTGSTRFGSLSSNTHVFTGSVSISGSSTFALNVNSGSLFVSSSGFIGMNTTQSFNSTLTVAPLKTPGVAFQVIADGDGRGTNLYTSDYVSLTTGSTLRMGFTGGSGNVSASIQAYNTGENTYGSLLLNSGGGSVGINTSSPDFPLTVQTNTAAQSLKILSRGSGDSKVSWYSADNVLQYAHIDIGTTYFQIYASNNQPIQFYTSGSGGLSLTLNADKSATFSTSLAVSTFGQFNSTTLRLGNDSNSGYNSIAFQGDSADGNNKIFGGSSTNDGVYIAAKTGQGIRFWVNGSTQALFINSSQAATFSSTITSQANGSTFGTAAASGRAITLQASSGDGAILFKNLSGGDGTLSAKGTSNTFDYSFNTYSVSNAFYLYNNGNYDFAGSDVSDLRLKENIKTIDYNATEKLMQLVPKSYNMIAHPNIKKSGFIAQEVKEIIPDFVTGEETDEDYLGIDYNGILALAVKAIQELKTQNDALQSRIETLESK